MIYDIYTCVAIIGCILAELFTGYPLFPGEDEKDQLSCIIEIFGLPKKRILATCKREKYFITSKGQPRYCIEKTDGKGNVKLIGSYTQKGKYRGPPMSRDFLTSLNNCPDALMVDFIRRCLAVNPDERMTPAEALHHGWLRNRP